MKKYNQLTIGERYSLKGLKKLGFSNKSIAKMLERHPSTIGRELRRNFGKKTYFPKKANTMAQVRRRNIPKRASKLKDKLLEIVIDKIKLKWSPEQISGWLPLHGFASLSHECIYQYITADRKAGGKLYKHLRRKGKKYRHCRVKSSRITNRVSIDLRPKCVGDKERIGDWEGDIIVGKGHKSAMLTLVERKSKYTLIAKLKKNKEAAPLRKTLVNIANDYKDIFHTLTVDNGLEFAEHEKITKALGAQVYFAHPFSSWERGLNENTNGLIRQFFSKGIDLNEVPIEEVLRTQNLLNGRPRKTLGFQTPYEVLIKEGVALVS